MYSFFLSSPFIVVWNCTVPWLPSCSFQPPQPQWDAAHHRQTAAVRWSCRSARSCTLHSVQAACRKTVCSEREHWVRPPPVIPWGVWLIKLRDSGRLPVTRVSLPELVWEWVVLATAVGSGALPEDMSKQVWSEGEKLKKLLLVRLIRLDDLLKGFVLKSDKKFFVQIHSKYKSCPSVHGTLV